MIGMLMMLMMMMEMMMVRQMMIMMRLPMLIMLMITMRVMMLKMRCWLRSPFVAQRTATTLPVPDWRGIHRALKCSSDWPKRRSLAQEHCWRDSFPSPQKSHRRPSKQSHWRMSF